MRSGRAGAEVRRLVGKRGRSARSEVWGAPTARGSRPRALERAQQARDRVVCAFTLPVPPLRAHYPLRPPAILLHRLRIPLAAMSTSSRPVGLVSVNTAPERAKKVLGEVCERVKPRYNIEHVGNADSTSRASEGRALALPRSVDRLPSPLTRSPRLLRQPSGDSSRCSSRSSPSRASSCVNPFLETSRARTSPDHLLFAVLRFHGKARANASIRLRQES